MSDLTVTNADVWNANVAIAPAVSILTTVGTWPLPALAAYAFLKVKRKSAGVVADIDAIRVKLCETHCAKNDDGTPRQVNGAYDLTPEAVAAINAEFATVLAESVTLTGCRAIAIAELGDAVRLTADDLAKLGPFLIESVS